MALETLKNVKKIGGFDVVDMGALKENHPEGFKPDGSMDYPWFEREIRPKNFIYVRHDVNSLSFTIQKGPIKEAGVNGCQVDTLIHAAKTIIANLDQQFPSTYNTRALDHLQGAIDVLEERKRDRESRGVEGRSLK